MFYTLLRRLIGAHRALAMVGLALLIWWPLARDFANQPQTDTDGIVVITLILAFMWMFLMIITGLLLLSDGEPRRKSSLALTLSLFVVAIAVNSFFMGELYVPVAAFVPPAQSHEALLWAILVLPLLLGLLEAVLPPWSGSRAVVMRPSLQPAE